MKYRILNTEREVQSCVMAFGNQVKQNSKQKQGNSTQTKQEKWLWNVFFQINRIMGFSFWTRVLQRWPFLRTLSGLVSVDFRIKMLLFVCTAMWLHWEKHTPGPKVSDQRSCVDRFSLDLEFFLIILRGKIYWDPKGSPSRLDYSLGLFPEETVRNNSADHLVLLNWGVLFFWTEKCQVENVLFLFFIAFKEPLNQIK